MFAQLIHGTHQYRKIMCLAAFRQLHHQSFRRELILLQDSQYIFSKIIILQLFVGYIYINNQAVRKIHDLADRRSYSICTYFLHHTCFFQDRNKFGWSNSWKSAIFPPEQCLTFHDLHGFRLYDRLIIQLKPFKIISDTAFQFFDQTQMLQILLPDLPGKDI